MYIIVSLRLLSWLATAPGVNRHRTDKPSRDSVGLDCRVSKLVQFKAQPRVRGQAPEQRLAHCRDRRPAPAADV